jgi:hypothetical protein
VLWNGNKKAGFFKPALLKRSKSNIYYLDKIIFFTEEKDLPSIPEASN